MPVFDTRKRWKEESLIPYTLPSGGVPKVRQAIKDLNTAVGWSLLIERSEEDDYLRIVLSDHCNSPVGRQGGAQDVQVRDELFTATHELMHGLGFHHEEKHKDFPWMDTRYDFGTKGFTPPLANGSWDASLWAAMKNQYPGIDIAAGNKCNDFRAAGKPNSGMRSIGQCDMGSIMMYRQIRDAVNEALRTRRRKGFPNPSNFISSETGGQLTDADEAALQEAYPKVNGFWLFLADTFNSDRAHSLYEVRSRSGVGGIIRGEIKNGKAAVLGIDRIDAEVRFPKLSQRTDSWIKVGRSATPRFLRPGSRRRDDYQYLAVGGGRFSFWTSPLS